MNHVILYYCINWNIKILRKLDWRARLGRFSSVSVSSSCSWFGRTLLLTSWAEGSAYAPRRWSWRKNPSSKSQQCHRKKRKYIPTLTWNPCNHVRDKRNRFLAKTQKASREQNGRDWPQTHPAQRLSNYFVEHIMNSSPPTWKSVRPQPLMSNASPVNTFEKSSSTKDEQPSVWPGVNRVKSENGPKVRASNSASLTSAAAPDTLEMADKQEPPPASCFSFPLPSYHPPKPKFI